MSIITTKHLTLRPLTRSSQRQVDWLHDPDVQRYSEQRHGNHTLSTQLRYVGMFIGRSKLWAIIDIESGEHIGNLSAMCDEPNNVTDVGVMIGNTKCWGKGYGREAWVAACDWLLDPHLGAMRKLEAGCMRDNLAMKKIIEASKFQYEGERVNHFLLEGAPVGMLLYGRSR